MAHLLAPRPPLDELPVFFNVDGAVGAPPAQNQREDVLLVQFCFEAIGRSPKPTTSAEVVEACRRVKVTGIIDDATISAISAFQRSGTHQNVVDGRVSPANGYLYGNAAFSIVNLNEALQDRNVDIWPRIDKIPNCPPELRKMVVRTCSGI